MASIVEQSWLIFSEEADGKDEGNKAEAAEWDMEKVEERAVMSDMKLERIECPCTLVWLPIKILIKYSNVTL